MIDWQRACWILYWGGVRAMRMRALLWFRGVRVTVNDEHVMIRLPGNLDAIEIKGTISI